MLKRHEDALMNRLEECVFNQGWCIIRNEEIRTWYSQKVTKPVWRDIIDRLNSLLDEPQQYKTYHYGGVRLIVLNDEHLIDLHALTEN